MSYSTATPAQQAQVNVFVQQQRAACIQFFRLMNQINALQTFWNADVLAILGTPGGIAIPDGTNLAGAVQLTDTQVTNLFGVLQSMLTTNFTQANQNAMALATGPGNISAA